MPSFPSHVLPLLLAAMLCGCATVGESTGAEPHIEPQLRLSGYQSEGAAQVQFTRVSRFGGAACDVRVFIDDTPIADVPAGKQVQFSTAARPALLRAHYAARGICPSQVSTLAITPTPGQTLRVVYDISHHGQHILQLR
jgi:starvation-inducible outer membrane lipoprotein